MMISFNNVTFLSKSNQYLSREKDLLLAINASQLSEFVAQLGD